MIGIRQGRQHQPRRRPRHDRFWFDRLEGRTLLDGSIDLAFGDLGATLPFGLDDVEEFAVQDDGKIVAVGQTSGDNADFAAVRLNADGTLDTSFGDGGLVTVAFDNGGGLSDSANGVAIQPDGRIVIVGGVEIVGFDEDDPTDFDFGVVRLNPDGSLDESFSTDGKRTVAIDLGDDLIDSASDVVIRPDGRIVIAGAAGDSVGVVRLDADGDRDDSFGEDGDVSVDGLGTLFSDQVRLLLQPDGKVLVSGSEAVARLDDDGSLDDGFGDGGIAAVEFREGVRNDIFSMALQSDGKVVLGGRQPIGPIDPSLGVPENIAAGLLRLDTDGTLDPTFGDGGRVTYEITGGIADDGDLSDLQIRPDGRIDFIGDGNQISGRGTDSFLYRLREDGRLDASFGDGGKVDLGTFAADQMALLPDGRTALLGVAQYEFNVAILVVGPDGVADPNFDDAPGRFLGDFGQLDLQVADTVIQADGKTILVGTGDFESGDTFLAIRLGRDGRPDPTWAFDGTAITQFDPGTSRARASAVAIQPDGKVVVAGTSLSAPGGDVDIAVVRYTADGFLDPTFGDEGKVLFSIEAGGNDGEEVGAVAIRPDGKIVILGTSDRGDDDSDFVVVRLNGDGSPDEGFGTSGRAFVAFDVGDNEFEDEGRGLILLPGGGILVAGVAQIGDDGDTSFAVARLGADGERDTSFGDGGTVLIAFPGFESADLRGIAAQGNGRIVLAGALVGPISNGRRRVEAGLARLDADGTLDASFGEGGRATFGQIGDARITSAVDVAVQRDGRIVAAVRVGGGNGDFGALRLDPSGTPDAGFGTGGLVTVAFDLSDSGLDIPTALALGPYGGIILAGQATLADANTGIVAVRLDSVLDLPTLIGDYDGDGQADLALYRYDPIQSAGVFAVRLSNFGSTVDRTATIPAVDADVIPVAGDFDGDGKTDFAVVDPTARIGGASEPNASVWILLLSASGDERREVPFGAAGVLDRPAPADYDGDGITDIATFRADSDLVPGAAQWFILPSAPNPGFRTVNGAFSVLFGAAGGVDLPAPFDYDGDGRADIATFRPVSDLVPGAAQWFVLPSGPNDATYTTTLGGFPVNFGAAGNADQPAVADYNGDGRDDITAFRSVTDLPGGERWFVLPSEGDAPDFGGGFPVVFGRQGDVAAVSDYDRDGRPDLALFSPDDGMWTIRESAVGTDRAVSYNPFGPDPGVVPVLAPLFFRLRATGNIPTGAASLAAMDAVIASDSRDARRRAGLFDDALEELLKDTPDSSTNESI